ncbi:MAG: hypothetical protein ACKVKM_13905, partial [Verrucomicrobiia bacterium]
GVILYRVIDEYHGDTLTGITEMESSQPLTLFELTNFFLNAWPLDCGKNLSQLHRGNGGGRRGRRGRKNQSDNPRDGTAIPKRVRQH